MARNDDIAVFAGSASRVLTAKICDYLGIPVGKNEVRQFSEGNTFVRVQQNVRGRRA